MHHDDFSISYNKSLCTLMDEVDTNGEYEWCRGRYILFQFIKIEIYALRNWDSTFNRY